MGWLRRHKVVEAIVDPSSRELSMSRIASGVMLVLDFIWVVVVVAGIPPHQAFARVSYMLSACTVATFGAYGLNPPAGDGDPSSWEDVEMRVAGEDDGVVDEGVEFHTLTDSAPALDLPG